jgi:hypothetical protein
MAKATKSKSVYSVSLDTDVMRQLVRIKHADGIPISQQVERAIRAWLAERKRRTTA